MSVNKPSLCLCKDRLRFQAGAGLVHDSDPATEFDETSHKLRGILTGLEASEGPHAPRSRRGGR